MFQCVLSSVLLMTTLMQSAQPCCVHASSSARVCCAAASCSRCDARDRASTGPAENRTTGSRERAAQRSCDSSQCAVGHSNPETDSSPPVPIPERRECPTCQGELPNLVTKMGELQFAPNTDQVSHQSRLPEVGCRSLRIGDTSGRRIRNCSRIRSPGHLLI